jgi:hypothetical protein
MRRLFRRGEAKEANDEEVKGGGASSSDAADLALVGACARYSLARGSLDRWERFIEAHAFVDAKADEHDLEHTAVHAKFVALVEDCIADFLRGRGHDARSFYAVVARLADADGEDRDGAVATFVALMTMATESALPARRDFRARARIDPRAGTRPSRTSRATARSGATSSPSSSGGATPSNPRTPTSSPGSR